MRLNLTVVDTRAGDQVDVAVDADSRSPVDVLARSLERLLRDRADRSAAGVTLFVGAQPVDGSAPLAACALREGAVVGLDGPVADTEDEAVGLVEIRVVGGPAAGTVHRIGVGTGPLGSAGTAWVPVPDPAMAPVAALLDVDSHARCWVTPADQETVAWTAGGTAAGTAAGTAGGTAGAHEEPALLLEQDGARVAVPGRTAWRPGRLLSVGDSLLEAVPYSPPDAALTPSTDGEGLDYNRPPRILPPRRETRFRLPAPPKEPARNPLPLLMAAVPVLGAVGLFVLTGNRNALYLAVLSPLAVLAGYLTNRRHGRRSHAALVREHRQRVERVEADAVAALDLELAERRTRCPDPATVLVLATGPRRRLWERRRWDDDHLLLRVGTADLPSEVTVEDPEQEEHRRAVRRTLPQAPVTVSLRDHGVLGVAGEGDAARAVGRWLVAQATVLHSPLDLQLVVLTDTGGRDSWEWVRWLPHARPAGGQGAGGQGGGTGPVVLIGTDTDSVARRVAYLLDLVNQRRVTRRDTGAAGFREPDVLVVLDGSRRLRSLPGMVQVLRDGPLVGVRAVCLDAQERLLPGECQAVVVAEPDGLRVSQAGADVVTAVRPDVVEPTWCTRVARAMAPLRDVSDEDDDSALPSSSRLLDVLSLDPPTGREIAARWAAGGRSTTAVVGESYDGPFEIDLRRDGPHGLVAGTTGSGKSELLQTVVASLAVANRPDAMTFVLVDYKGGSAFADCVRLPHTVGMVTDLDEHLVGRALESLSAELRRREHLLAAAGAKDIEDFQRTAPAGEPLPRLLIVIDEFASMARDLPDFVKGLVNVAQRGRSLGIHLLLATQRPSGVVSPEIRANTNLRIALRVTDAAESQDVLDAPDAARIAKTTPGRAFVRLGHSSLVPFQAGRVGGRRVGPALGTTRPPRVVPLGWADLGRAVDLGPVPVAADEDEVTDLRALVEALRDAAELAAVPAQHSPWLPALPASLTLDDLDLDLDLDPGPWDGSGLRPVPYGLQDLPSQQARRTAALDLARFGHLLASGSPRSGRSQLLRAVAGSVARTHSTADVHLYGLDCGNGALLPLTQLPHCGAVVTRTQVERAVRLLARFGEEIRRRQEVLAAGGFADVTEQRAGVAATDRLPHLLLLIDRWEGFTSTLGELDAGALTDQVLTFLREGASVGVHLLVTGDRSLLTGRIATLSDDRISFRLADRGDFSLIGLSPRTMPEDIAPGRAFTADSGVETQVALLVPDASGPAQAAALAEIAGQARERDATVPAALRPFRLGELPTAITFTEAWTLRDPGHGAAWALAGVGGDQLTALGPDLSEGVPAFAIGGPARSGRSTALLAVVRSYLERGQQVVVLAPRTSPLRDLAGEPGVIDVLTGTDVSDDELSAALGKADGPTLIAVDDAQALQDMGAAARMRQALREGVAQGLAVAVAGEPEELSAGFSGWLVDVRKARRGLLLSPQNRTDGDLVGVRLPRTAVGQPVQPGRGLLHLGDGETVPVQVPLP